MSVGAENLARGYRLREQTSPEETSRSRWTRRRIPFRLCELGKPGTCIIRSRVPEIALSGNKQMKETR